MTARILDGKAVAETINRETAVGAATLMRERGVRPGLAVVLVGENPASRVYVNTKEKKAAELGLPLGQG